MLPEQYLAFARSLVAVSVFGSNVLFWQESGYFGAAAEENPLLHTWSLAVEEQFYILFPLAVLLIWRLGRRALVGAIALVGLISLGLSHYAAQESPAANFYLLPTRAWELMAGALCALALDRRAPPGNDALAGLGLALILGAVMLFDRTTPFPSLWALAPVGGTALIVLFARPGGRVAQVLAWRPMVAVGLVSYSAYLWHQPLFAFARTALPGSPPAWLMLTLAAAALGLAALSWRFVEQPFRSPRRIFVGAQLPAALVPAMVLLAGIGVHGHLSDGRRNVWLATAPSDQAHMYRLYEDARAGGLGLGQAPTQPCIKEIPSIAPRRDRLERCFDRHGPGLLVVGDSHSRMVMPALQRLTGRAFVVSLARGGCRPFTPRPECRFYAEIGALVAERPEMFSHIVYHSAGQAFLDDGTAMAGEPDMFHRYGPDETMEPFAPYEGRIANVRDYLSDLVVPGGPQVIWLGPQIGHYLPMRALIRRGCEAAWSLRPGLGESFAALDRAIADRMAEEGEVDYISLREMIRLDPANDIASCDALYWIDGHHWSQAGMARFGPRLAPLAELVHPARTEAHRDD
jgi:hypothetical protein